MAAWIWKWNSPGRSSLVKQVAQGKFKKIAGLKVTTVEDLDGAKMRFGDSAWLLVRASGTENLLRLYAEAPSHEQVKELLGEMTRIALSGDRVIGPSGH